MRRTLEFENEIELILDSDTGDDCISQVDALMAHDAAQRQEIEDLQRLADARTQVITNRDRTIALQVQDIERLEGRVQALEGALRGCIGDLKSWSSTYPESAESNYSGPSTISVLKQAEAALAATGEEGKDAKVKVWGG